MAIKIFIDQGHNPQGINAGAEGNGLREQDITYNVGIYLRDLLNNNSCFQARTSRNTPTESLGVSNTSSLRTRVQAANNWPANYFISLHCNASDNPSYNGTEVYVVRANSEAYYLAEYILNAIVARVGTRNNGVRLNPSLYVLRNTTMPAILVEMGYITNVDDAQKLRDDQYQFAYAIYEGLLEYFDLTNVRC